jgi:hypothetical protein
MSNPDNDSNDGGGDHEAWWDEWVKDQREEDQRRLYGREDFETISVNDDEESFSSSWSGSSGTSVASTSLQLDTEWDGDALPGSSIESARDSLRRIFTSLEWHRLRGCSAFVMRILSKYPVLAAEIFQDPNDDHRYPLSQMILACASLGVVQKVYHMCEEAISIQEAFTGDLPLHDACWHVADTDVIRFLVTEFPAALTIQNSARRLPVHDAVRNVTMSSVDDDPRQINYRRLTSSATIRFLIDSYPGCMARPDNDGRFLLESVLYHGYGVDLFTYMIERYPLSFQVFRCGGPNMLLDFPTSRAMTQLFSTNKSIQTFRCDPLSWTTAGFVFLMNYLASNTSLESLEFLSFPGDLVVDHQDAAEGFVHFLEHNSSLQELSISIPKQPNLLHNVADACLHLIADALESNTNSGLQLLELKQTVVTNCYSVKSILLMAGSPKELVFDQVTFRPPTGTLNPHGVDDPRGLIESVTFRTCHIDQPTLQDIFENLAVMPSLRRLKLDFNPAAPGLTQVEGLNLTDPLRQLLAGNRLERLDLSPVYKFDLSLLTDVLTRNTSLETFRGAPCYLVVDALLQILHHNTTLTDCAIQPRGRHDRLRDKVTQLLRLNQFGRGRIRAGLGKMDYVILLIELNNDERLNLPIDNFNVLHGILNEAPALWSDMG